MMYALTTDIAPEAIEQLLEYLREGKEHLDKLKEQKQVLQEQIEKEESHLMGIKHDVQWRQLMAEVEVIRNEEYLHNDKNGGNSIGITHLCVVFEDAIQKFKSSLIQPEDYDSGSGDESVIPYSDTDDYADFTIVEDVIEDALGGVESLLMTNSTTQSGCSHTRKSSFASLYAQEAFADHKFSASSNSSQTCSFSYESVLGKDRMTTARKGSCSDATDGGEEYRAARRRGLLLLLVLSLYVGRIEELCGFGEIPDQSDVPSADADEARDSVVAMWQSLLYESRVLTEDERKEWISIVTRYLGSPFDTPPLRSII